MHLMIFLQICAPAPQVRDCWHTQDLVKIGHTVQNWFKSMLISCVRPQENSIYSNANLQGTHLLTRWYLECSSLIEHRFWHSFDCLTLFCSCGMANELKIMSASSCTSHYLLSCVKMSKSGWPFIIWSHFCSAISYSAERDNCTHRKICSRSMCTPNFRPCTRIVCV